MAGKQGRGAARSRRCGGAPSSIRALVSFLDAHGYSRPLDAEHLSEEEAVCRLAAGPVPPAFIRAAGSMCRCEALPLIERAAALSQKAAGATGASVVETRRRMAPSLCLDEAFARLAEALGEERQGQLEMARAVRRALDEDRLALLEAGTGTGKSLAYLVPSVLFSLETGERIVVSTHTKNLQDQLCRKEIPVLEKALSVDARAARLLGRGNYLCSRNIVARAASLMEETSEAGLALALHAALAGEEGTVESLGALPEGVVVMSVAAPYRCPMNACALADRCPLVRARRRAREAGILFVNHALLLTDYRQGGSALGPYSRIVFDEAHHLERCVIENLSVKVTREDITRIIEPLRLREKDDDAWKLLAHELAGPAVPDNWRRLRRTLARKANEMEECYRTLFQTIEGNLNARQSLRSMKTRYTDGGETFAASTETMHSILLQINAFIELLKPMCEVSCSRDASAFQQEFCFAKDEIATLSESLRFLADGEDEASVFWLDWGSRGALREVCGSPLSVDRPFADYLESVLGTAVFTSATLSQSNSFAFFKERMGLRLLPAKPLELIIPSPFPFEENCLVLAVSGLGDPNDECFTAPVSEIIAGLADKVARRTMVLFTSYRLCLSVAGALERLGVRSPLLVQGAGESRETLSERFRRSASGILLGVASFWEGVDFPGEELEVLVIPKIPFPVPSEPIVEARSERLVSLGEEVFEMLYLPEAIQRMRQGAGRLIRRMDDRGVIMILDSRLGTRPYAARILSALPSANVMHVSPGECVDHARRWFEGSREHVERS